VARGRGSAARKGGGRAEALTPQGTYAVRAMGFSVNSRMEASR
jgi:hypothetical protein